MVLDSLKFKKVMNSSIPLEVGNLDGIVVLIALVMFGPALLLLIIGLILNSKQNKKAAKVFFILAGAAISISISVEQYAGLMPGSIFLIAGLVCEIVALLGTDKAVANMWKSK